MKKSNQLSRNMIIMIFAGVALLALVYALWPKPLIVDMVAPERGMMTVTIDEEARTRVRDAYVVSAPIAGRLLRVEVEPGDEVQGGETVIANMLANPPSALDVRTREQARAGVSAAQASLRVSQADLNSALADQDLADADFLRYRTLTATGAAAQARLDQAERAKRSADAHVDTAKAAISMREAELANARARLIEFDQRTGAPEGIVAAGETIPLSAPISGRVLRVLQESEMTVSPGQPILEIGDTSNDLEVIAELLSTDAVQVKAGDQVIIDKWGGDEPLQGVVERVEPWGFTKFSALGVEEQRVNIIIRFADPLEQRIALGHGYRVEVQIVVWQSADALIIPSSALFRMNGGWAVFKVQGGRARQVEVSVRHSNGPQTAIEAELSDEDLIVPYPASELKNGSRVKQRETSN